jgi:hypothetical protein
MKSAFVLWLFAFCFPARPAFLCGVVLFNSVPGSIVSFPNYQTAPHNTALCSRCCWFSLCLRVFFGFASAYFSFSMCMHIMHGPIKSPWFYSILPGSVLGFIKRPSLDSDLIFAASNQNACHLSFESTWHQIPWQLAAGKPMLFGVAKKEPASGEKPRSLGRSMARLVPSHCTCERCFQHARWWCGQRRR